MKDDRKYPAIIWTGQVAPFGWDDEESRLRTARQGRVIMKESKYDATARRDVHDLVFEVQDGEDAMGQPVWKKIQGTFREFLSDAAMAITKARES